MGTNQLKPLSVTKEVDAALADLVGDLATYEPGRKAIIFEGGGDTDFDQTMTLGLFPELGKLINLISGTNKNKVRALHEVLSKAYEKGDLKTDFYAIVDNDFDDDGLSEIRGAVKTFKWDVYHIENYLLEESIIAHVVNSLSMQTKVSAEQVLEQLRDAARRTVPFAVRHRVTEYVSKALVTSIDLRFDPAAGDFSGAIMGAADRSLDRLAKLKGGALSEDKVRAFESAVTQEIETSFGDGSWRRKLPGRSILKAYVETLANGISADTLRSMIVSRMVDLSYQPPGMKTVIDAILAA